MAKALYRQYRPKTFDQVLGQDRVVNVLKIKLKIITFLMLIFLLAKEDAGRLLVQKFLQKLLTAYILLMDRHVLNVRIVRPLMMNLLSI